MLEQFFKIPKNIVRNGGSLASPEQMARKN